MAKKAADSCYDGDDWLVVGCDDSRREVNLQPETNSGKGRGLEASQNQILDSDSPQFDENTESDPNQMSIFQLLVWHKGLKKPVEIVDDTQKPLLVTAHKSWSVQDLLKMVQEMVIVQPQLRGVFSQVTRENFNEVLQVCQRLDEKMKWLPLEKDGQTEEVVKSSANLQMTSQIDLPNGNQCGQLLVEEKFQVEKLEDVADWRCGRFYSDIEENAWRYELQIGQVVDALDTDNRWYESRIVDMDAVYVKVHYRGWTSKWDEWLRRTSERLAPLHTKVPNWRAFQVNDEILVGSEVPGKRYPEWRNARVTAYDSEDGSLQIEVDIDGKKKWMDAQDDLLCQKGTHKAVNAIGKVDQAAFSVPPSLLFNYFERPDELPPSPSRQEAIVDAVESVREATHSIHLADSDGEGDEWCVVDDDNDERDVSGVGTDIDNRKVDTVVESEVAVAEGTDTSSASAGSAFDAVRSDEHPKQGLVSATVDQIFTMTTEVLDCQMDTTISKKEAWRYQLQMDQLIDARDTDNVWYESRVVALSSTLVKLHYRGWTSKWDEWIERTSTRIAPLHTMVQNWRDFKAGDNVMVGQHVATKRYPEWRNAVVTACEACEVDGRLRIEVDIDGSKQWMDAQDEMLCPPGTHKAINSLMLKHMVPLF